MKVFILLAVVSAAFAATAFDMRCTQLPDSGPCKAMMPMWWFNARTGKCELFNYGGCGGNENRYESKRQCEMTCSASKPSFWPERHWGVPSGLFASVADVCRRPAYSGICMASIPRFYYDAQTKQCRQFIYGGCHSNGNNFETLRQCMDACAIQSPWEPMPRHA
ncbi:boophilin-H2-like isoform X1 [Amblyomma americanum]